MMNACLDLFHAFLLLMGKVFKVREKLNRKNLKQPRKKSLHSKAYAKIKFIYDF